MLFVDMAAAARAASTPLLFFLPSAIAELLMIAFFWLRSVLRMLPPMLSLRLWRYYLWSLLLLLLLG